MNDTKITDLRIFKEEELRNLWTKGQKIMIEGISYRIGKMSYGDYFFEPGQEHGEKDGFNPGTLWPEKIKGIWHLTK